VYRSAGRVRLAVVSPDSPRQIVRDRNFWFHDYPNAERNENTELELYDLEDDPMETNNVAADPAYNQVREELYERLRDRLERDNDPILDGPIPPKQGEFDVGM